MARLIVVFLLLWMAGLAQGASFVIGLAPIHSMRILAQRYEPLRAYLEAQLGRPVFVESAPDFAEFQARTLRGEFDLTLSPAHFARLAQKDKGFQPIVQFLPDHDAMLVYSVDRPLSSVGLLKNQPLAVIDRLTIGTMAALNYLEEHGLEAGRDYRVVEFHTHAGLGQSLANGTALAGVTTTPGLKQMPEAVRDKLRVFARIADIPAFVILAKPGASRTERERLQQAVLDFGRDKAGQAFLKGVAYSALVPADEQSLKRVDPDLKATRKGLMP